MRCRQICAGLIVCAALAACTASPEKNATDARRILDAAHRALGGSAVDAISTLHAAAVVHGPEAQFVTMVWSGTDGRGRMEQSTGFVAVTHPTGDWQIDPSNGESAALDPEILASLRGHELHATVLAPESRYSDPRFAGEEEFWGKKALAVEFVDNLGRPVFYYFAAGDTMPLGLRLTHPEPDVSVILGDWIAQEGARLFRTARFLQGSTTYNYGYSTIELNSVSDSVFVHPRSHMR